MTLPYPIIKDKATQEYLRLLKEHIDALEMKVMHQDNANKLLVERIKNLEKRNE